VLPEIRGRPPSQTLAVQKVYTRGEGKVCVNQLFRGMRSDPVSKEVRISTPPGLSVKLFPGAQRGAAG